jgi:hypothetical protein
MIHPEGYALNNDLAVLVQTLHRELQESDEKVTRQIIENMKYLLQSHAAKLSSYNALEIETEIDIEQRTLPAVDRDTYRPHVYLRAMGNLAREGIVPVSFIIPFPLREEGMPYEIKLRLYTTEARKVPGLTINMGRDPSINIFFYANEIKRIRIGHVVENEYARLLVSKRD